MPYDKVSLAFVSKIVEYRRDNRREENKENRVLMDINVLEEMAIPGMSGGTGTFRRSWDG